MNKEKQESKKYVRTAATLWSGQIIEHIKESGGKYEKIIVWGKIQQSMESQAIEHKFYCT